MPEGGFYDTATSPSHDGRPHNRATRCWYSWRRGIFARDPARKQRLPRVRSPGAFYWPAASQVYRCAGIPPSEVIRPDNSAVQNVALRGAAKRQGRYMSLVVAAAAPSSRHRHGVGMAGLFSPRADLGTGQALAPLLFKQSPLVRVLFRTFFQQGHRRPF